MVKKKIIVFCAGYYYEIYHEWLEENYEIVALVDNDETKWGKLYYGHRCVSLEEALSRKPEQVIMATVKQDIAKAVSKQVKDAAPNMDVIRIGKVADNSITLKKSDKSEGQMVKKKIIVFCVGSCYKAYHEWLEENYEIVALADNDKTKWGKTYYGHQCGSLEIALSMRPEQVIIATTNRSITNAVLAQVKKASPDMDVIVIEKIADYNVVLKNSEHKKYYIDKLDNKIIFDGNATFEKMNFIFEGKNNKVRIGDGVRADFMHVFFSGNDNCLEIGEKTTIGSVQMLLAESGKIMIGNDCMLSTEIEIFQSASHPIFDLQTGVRLNCSRNVRIGNHVWVGRRSALMSGFSIGDGSVVGFGSVTSGQFGENVIIAGSPAKVIRKDVRWERDSLLYKLDHVSDCLRGAEVTTW